jgi:5,10-methylenetetrahydromethanopterin reductase
MRFSLRLNNDLTVPQYEALAQAAEGAGFDQFWVSHDLFLRSSSVILPIVARATTKIEIGSCIFNPYTINPAELAMFAGTMDELSGNRFNLGLAAGAKEFLQWVGLAQERPLTAMRETIAIVRRLLSGEPSALHGQFVQWSPEAFLRHRDCAPPAIGRSVCAARSVRAMESRSLLALPGTANHTHLCGGNGTQNAWTCRRNG